MKSINVHVADVANTWTNIVALCKYKIRFSMLHFCLCLCSSSCLCLSVCAFISRCYASRKVLLTQYLWNMWNTDRKTEFLSMLTEAKRVNTHTHAHTHSERERDSSSLPLLLLPSPSSSFLPPPSSFFRLQFPVGISLHLCSMLNTFCGKVLQHSPPPPCAPPTNVNRESPHR